MNSLEANESPEGVGKAPLLLGGVVALVSVAALKYSRGVEPSQELRAASLLPYCEDIVTALSDEDYAIVGGLAIDAFNHEASDVLPDQSSIIVSKTFDSRLLRETNWSVRDYDIFPLPRNPDGSFQVLSAAEQLEIKQRILVGAEQRAHDLQQPTPEMAVFSFDTKASLFHTATMVNDDGRVSLRQGHVEQTLPADAMRTWTLNLPSGLQTKVLNPWEQYWRSMVRFSSGMKTKDREKLDTMLQKLRATPGLAEMEDEPLCEAYRTYHERMLAGNSPAAVATELRAVGKQLRRLKETTVLALASTTLGIGEKNRFISKLVQNKPTIFNHFIGGN